MSDDIPLIEIMVSFFVFYFIFYYIIFFMTIQMCTFKGAVSAVDTDVLFMVDEGVTC